MFLFKMKLFIEGREECRERDEINTQMLPYAGVSQVTDQQPRARQIIMINENRF